MKLIYESIKPDSGSSFRILLTPNLNDIYYWHFHPEIEIVYVEAEKGIRHIGDHISTYEKTDLALIGSNIPHLNFDYAVKTRVETIVIQLKQNFFSEGLHQIPEFESIIALFELVKTGVAFYGDTKKQMGQRLKQIVNLPKFDQFIELIQIFHFLSKSKEYILLNARPISSQTILKQQEWILHIYKHVEENFKNKIDTNQVAKKMHLTVPAFCRSFKKSTKLTYTDFVNQYRISYAKKLLLQDRNISETCFESGFENLSYFNRTFKKYAGLSPSVFKKNNLNL